LTSSRIKITDLVKAGSSQLSTVQLEDIGSSVPCQEQLPTPPPSPRPTNLVIWGPCQASFRCASTLCNDLEILAYCFLFISPDFLQGYDVSIVNITNLITRPYNKDDQYIRAFMSEIVSDFKDIAQLNPHFRY
jgi:ATP-dependent Lon protease